MYEQQAPSAGVFKLLVFFPFMLPCDVLTKALHIFFRAAGGK